MTVNYKEIKILVIDDEIATQRVIGSILEMMGVEQVVFTTDAKGGFEIFKNYQPDIVITDWVMGDIDGLELVRLIRTSARTINPYVPIIMMTDHSFRHRVIAARDCGVNEFLAKPFKSKELYKRINDIVNKPRVFIDSPNFFGPDRRRKNSTLYNGLCRREEDLIASGKIASSSKQRIYKFQSLKEMATRAGARIGKESAFPDYEYIEVDFR
jgi:DNA-binding response OmpR family regulator